VRLLDAAPRNLFFTGKGGVGKTSVACATALGLAARGRRTLLVSTDPASNLDETLGVALGPAPREIPGAPGLSALNIDPVAAAAAYCERMVAPYRGVLPPAALRSMEEQFSGACTVEIAAFDAFAGLLGGDGAAAFDHVVFDTAPTGHTLRLLHLPAAWSGFLEGNAGGVSCLGPLAGLAAQAALYAATQRALADPASTCVVLVARAERSALKEAERTRGELAEAGVRRMELVVNALFAATDRNDPLAVALERREAAATAALPAGLAALPRTTFPLLADDTVGLDRLRALLGAADVPPAATPFVGGSVATDRFDPALWPSLEALLPALAAGGSGVVMTMGKGGVGKTSIAVRLARLLHAAGHRVRLTTTDPAAHVVDALGVAPEGLIVDRIDPAVETRAYAAEILAAAGADLDAAGRALLEEDLRSPCTEEIAVFRAFARVVAAGREGFVVVDTAPTGHTLLLLDAAESYHREVSRTAGRAPPEVRELLPRLRDPAFTKIALVALPEATPVHEAAALQRDLARAGIRPFAWIVNRSYAPLRPTDPVLARRRASEFRYLDEVRALADRVALVPWSAEEPAPRP
jgi:arsenite-transporting ATPase